MTSNARIDSLQLMLTDLRMRNEPIRHKAAFRGCQPEFQALVSRLIEQLEGELLDEKQRSREASRLSGLRLPFQSSSRLAMAATFPCRCNLRMETSMGVRRGLSGLITKP